MSKYSTVLPFEYSPSCTTADPRSVSDRQGSPKTSLGPKNPLRYVVPRPSQKAERNRRQEIGSEQDDVDQSISTAFAPDAFVISSSGSENPSRSESSPGSAHQSSDTSQSPDFGNLSQKGSNRRPSGHDFPLRRQMGRREIPPDPIVQLPIKGWQGQSSDVQNMEDTLSDLVNEDSFPSSVKLEGDNRVLEVHTPKPTSSPKFSDVPAPSVPLRSSRRLSSSMRQSANERQPRVRQVVRDGVAHQMVSDGGLQYEYVEGAIMDTHPSTNAVAGDMQETIPEIEARDIQKIPERRPAITAQGHAYQVTPDDSCSTTTSDSGESDGHGQVASQNASSSTSTPETDSTVSDHFKSLPAWPLGPSDRARGSHVDQSQYLPTVEAPVQEQGTENGPANVQALSFGGLEVPTINSDLLMKRYPLDVIDEEDKESLSGGKDSDGRPSPSARRARNEGTRRVDGRSLRETWLSSPTTGEQKIGNETSSTDADMTGVDELPKILTVSGTGADMNLYEGRRVVLREESDSADNMTSSSSHGSLGPSDDSGSQSSASSGVFHAVENGIGKVVHAVKKKVTFNPIEDIRTITPTSNLSLDDRRVNLE